MEGVLLDAVSRLCVVCCRPLCALHRVVGAYRAGDLFSATPDVEVGLFVGGTDVRPLFRHVSCEDPKLDKWQMRPDIQYCIRCRKGLARRDVVQPVFGVQDAMATNPFDPKDKGLTLGERIYFIHVDCQRPDLSQGRGLLVKA